MPKVVLTSNIITADTIASVNEPVTISAQTAGGLTVTVPASTVPGDTILLNADGTAPTHFVEGTNLFSSSEAANALTVVG